MINSAICRQCAAENRGKQRSCLICGAPLPFPGNTTTTANAVAAAAAESSTAAPAATPKPVTARAFCTGCGAALSPGKKFCTKCGKSAI